MNNNSNVLSNQFKPIVNNQIDQKYHFDARGSICGFSNPFKTSFHTAFDGKRFPHDFQVFYRDPLRSALGCGGTAHVILRLHPLCCLRGGGKIMGKS